MQFNVRLLSATINLKRFRMIEVLRPGLFTTLHDLGRFGYRAQGVPVSGPMDSRSAAYANALLDNHANSPLVEMAFVGASFLFHQSAIVAFSGAQCEVKLNNEIIENQSVVHVATGSTFSFGALTQGNFLYLAVVGGFESERFLGSVCYYESISGISRMIKGSELHFNESHQRTTEHLTTNLRSLSSPTSAILVEKGPEFHLLSEENRSALMNTSFSISPRSNRMGFLLNESVSISLNEIISSPVQPGTIQLTQAGQLIVLMRDAQTTGGYPRILQLSEESINQLAQFPLNSTFHFRLDE